jgi:hypothetical protein
MPPATATEERCYLLVLEGTSSRIVDLPPRGEIVVGSAAACAVRLDAPSPPTKTRSRPGGHPPMRARGGGDA